MSNLFSSAPVLHTIYAAPYTHMPCEHEHKKRVLCAHAMIMMGWGGLSIA